MRRPKVVFFDLDDTLTTFDQISVPTWRKVCAEQAKKHEGVVDGEVLFQAVNLARKQYWSDAERAKKGRDNMQNARRGVVALAFQNLSLDDPQWANEIADEYCMKHKEGIKLMPKVREGLEKLKERGIPMAVITNGASAGQREKLARFHITDYFDEIYIDTETGFSKPDVRSYEVALAGMGVSPEDAWMIGDNLIWDIKGAQDAGLFAVWVDATHHGQKALHKHPEVKPDLVVESVYEMVEAICAISTEERK